MSNFSHQNLQNRSFRGRNLTGADFSGADIRGCDFSKAILQDANFTSCKAGQSMSKFFSSVVCAVFIATLASHANSQMLFGILGRIPGDKAWPYAIALFISLGIAGVGAGVRGIISIKSLLGKLTLVVTAAANSALLGFFYGGMAGGKNPQVASISAALAAVVMAVISLYYPRSIVNIVVATSGAIAAYGFCFLMIAIASALISTGNLISGMIWGILSLAAIAIMVIALNKAIQDITSFGTTSFRFADLTNANFDNANKGNSDFSGAIGYQS